MQPFLVLGAPGDYAPGADLDLPTHSVGGWQISTRARPWRSDAWELFLFGWILNQSDWPPSRILSALEALPFSKVLDELEGAFILIAVNLNTQELHAGGDALGQGVFFYQPETNTLASSLNLFDRHHGTNEDWLQRYIHGDFRIDESSPMKGIGAVTGRRLIKGSRGQLSPVARSSFYQSLAAHHRASPRQSAAVVYPKIASYLSQSLAALKGSDLEVHQMLSHGVDSLALMALAEQAELPVNYHVMCFPGVPESFHAVNEDLVRTRNLRGRFHARSPRMEDMLRGFEDLDYDLPLNATWANLVLFRHHLLAPIPSPSRALLLTGNGGDEALLHRHRYRAAFQLWRAAAAGVDLPSLSFAELRRLLVDRSRDYGPGSYSYRPEEISDRFFSLFIGTCSGDFFRYLEKERHLDRGISIEREYSLSTGMLVASPFNDRRILREMVTLEDSELLRAMEAPEFLRYFDPSGLTSRIFVPKAENFFPSTRAYPASPALLAETLESWRKLRPRILANAEHFDRALERAMETGSFDWELVRILTYRRWEKSLGLPLGN